MKELMVYVVWCRKDGSDWFPETPTTDRYEVDELIQQAIQIGYQAVVKSHRFVKPE